MTEQETRAFKRMAADIKKAVETSQHAVEVAERIERALLGDPVYGNEGIVAEHEDMKTRLVVVERRLDGMEAVNDLLQRALGKAPVLLFGAGLLYIGSGGNIAAVWHVLAGATGAIR
jgi:hypothetical protein